MTIVLTVYRLTIYGFISINPAIMTKFLKKDDLNSKWFEIDATGAVVGRLATVVSKILRGKNKATFTPHMDSGDFVVVKNVDQLKFTGNKFSNKKYYRHTGHPGGIKETTPEILQASKPGEVLKMAVKRMLPGGPLAKKQLTKLKVYSGSDHPHSAQNPEVIEIGKLNSKNIVNHLTANKRLIINAKICGIFRKCGTLIIFANNGKRKGRMK